MGVSKKTVQVRCVGCRVKTKMYSTMNTLESRILKQGWTKEKDGKYTCPACKQEKYIWRGSHWCGKQLGKLWGFGLAGSNPVLSAIYEL